MIFIFSPENYSLVWGATDQKVFILFKTSDLASVTEIRVFRRALNDLPFFDIPDSYGEIVGACRDAFSIGSNLIDGLQMRRDLEELSFGVDVMKVGWIIECKDNEAINFS